MIAYILKRLALSAAIVLSVTVLLFGMLHSVPGDPATIALGTRATPEVVERYREEMGLDKPLPTQIAIYVGNVLQGDLGRDVFSDRPVARIVLNQMSFTLALITAALAWSVLIGIPLGCLSAVWPNTLIDRMTGVVSVGTIAIPSFLVSIWSLLVFAVMLGWLPAIGAGDPGEPLDQLYHLVLPAFAVGLGWVGYLARMVRASMLEVMGESYIRAARAFGLPPRTVVFRYALRIAILPTITLIGMGFSGLISGAVFAEVIFARPGVGKLIVEAVNARNFPIVQGAVLLATSLYIVITLLSDLIVAWLDPRVRETL